MIQRHWRGKQGRQDAMDAFEAELQALQLSIEAAEGEGDKGGETEEEEDEVVVVEEQQEEDTEGATIGHGVRQAASPRLASPPRLAWPRLATASLLLRCCWLCVAAAIRRGWRCGRLGVAAVRGCASCASAPCASAEASLALSSLYLQCFR